MGLGATVVLECLDSCIAAKNQRVNACKYDNGDQVHLHAFVSSVVLRVDGDAGPDIDGREDGVLVQQGVANENDKGDPEHDDGPHDLVPSIGDASLLEADGCLEDESRAQPAGVK